MSNLPPLEMTRPGEFPSVGSASFELAARRRRGYARLFKERGRFILHIHLLPGRAQDLFNAAAENEAGTVQKLVRDGADVNVQDYCGNTVLMEAVGNRHVPAAKALLELGAEINARNNQGITALMMAYSQLDMIVLLLEHGADPNDRDHEGRTVLSMAMVKRQAKAASLLIERGAYVNVRGPGRQPLIELAVNTMPDEVVRMMLDRGAEGSPDGHKQQPSN